MLELPGPKEKKAQISLEFLIVYSFVLIIFIIMFALIATQRAATLVQQQYSLLQSQAQAIATYIDQAVSSGSGYSATLPLLGGFITHSYNVSISSTGVIILGTKSGMQPITAYAFSNAKSFVINGTLLQSANGISVYQLQTYKGSISIYNSRGIIYINQQPVSTTNLAQGMLATQQANVKAAQFNGQTSYITVGSGSSLNIGTGGATISAWIKPMAAADGNKRGIYSVGGGAGITGLIFAYRANSGNNLYIEAYDGSHNPNGFSLQSLPVGVFSYVVVTRAGGTFTFYINGVASGTVSDTTGNLNNGAAVTIGEAQGSSTNIFNGLIADVQIYNTALTAAQVNALYANSLSAQPVLPANNVGWWPLNGNANDYSGYLDHGAPNSISYQSVLQLSALLIPASNSLIKPIAGFVASAGSLGYNGLSVVNYTDSSSVAHAFLSSNGAVGSGNVVVDLFNGNTSTESNLVGWWPLDTGYGNVIYDLSGQYNNGAFNSFAWSSANRTDFAVASFPGNPASITSSNTQDGFITVNSAQSLLSIGINSTFTVVGWIYYKGATPLHMQGIFGDLPNWPPTGAGFQLVGYGGVVLYVNGSSVPFPGSATSFPANSWEMVTAQYNGSTGLANVYLNNTLFASNVLPAGLGLVQVQPFYIGDDAWQSTGLDTFNGLITNLQLYSAYLTQNQIGALYAQGPASTPLGDSGLVSWWPLAGNAKDYSFNNNTGTVNYNVAFQNGNYTNNFAARSQGQSFAYFNGQTTSYVNAGQVDSISGSQISVCAWVDPSGMPNAFPTIVSKDGAIDDYQLGLAQSGTSFKVMACSHVGSFGNCSTSNGIIGVNRWSYIGYTYDGSNLKIYINGLLDTTIPKAGSLSASSDRLVVGASSLFQWPFKGGVADVQLYNTALTQQQVMQLYAQGFPPQSRLNVSLG